MKIYLPLFTLLFAMPVIAQEHFSGISTSKRVGIINVLNNPSELANLDNNLEIQLAAVSLNASSNKIGFSDLVEGKDFEDLVFSGKDPVNFKMNAQIIGPGAALKVLNWGFAITSKANIQANIVDVDPSLGRALTTGNVGFLATNVNSTKNQRVSATTWGEIGFSAARKIYANDRHQFNGGLTLKLLFPGSYANIGAGGFGGTIHNNLGNLVLNDAHANLNIAYSGSLSNDFTNTSDYTGSLFGNLKGVAADFGFDYQLKNDDDSYRLKAGVAFKNMGSMTFKSQDNHATNYELKIPDGTSLEGLDLNQFDGSESIKDIENVLINSGYLNINSPKKTDFKVKLPAVLNIYTDVNIIPKLNATLYWQQKLNEDNSNMQITSQNLFSITPRFTMKTFEAYLPLSFNEISGTTLGVGFRLGGFFIGSSAIVTALTSDSNQADVYFGFRFGV